MSDPDDKPADEPTEEMIPEDVLARFRCPLTRSAVRQEGAWLVAEKPAGAGLRYPIKGGIPQLLMDQAQLPDGVESLEAFKAKYADEVSE